MKHERISPERLQAMLNAANAKAREEDCLNRLSIRAEVNALQNATRINTLRCWGGDQC
jgi:hypothetical protein